MHKEGNNYIMKRFPSIRIIGIDPGFGRLGYGIIESSGDAWQAVEYGVITTDKSKSFAARLMEIQADLKKIISRHKPTEAAIEELFFAKNARTAIAVGQARGVALVTLAAAGLPIHEFTPLQVKQSLTGYGRAEKKQLQRMVRTLLSLRVVRLQDDAADALAVALTCAATLPFLRATQGRQLNS